MEFLKRKLKNGMTVIMEKRELPVVSLSITNRFGGANEKSEIKGIAHFIEHLVFTGTKTRTHEDIAREIEKRGGILNAYTANEMTSFWFKLPSEHVFYGLEILWDMLTNPIFDKEKFEKEKKVILEEIKMYHDDPKDHIFEKMAANMYENPFGEWIIGSKETIENMDRDFVADFFKKHYNPENYIVTIVGDADFEKICEFLEKKFVKNKENYEILKIKKKKGMYTEEREGIDQAHFAFGIHAPLRGSKEFYALGILDAYLAYGMSSRLFLEIREKRGLAYTVRSVLEAEKNYSHYIIYVGTMKDKVEEVKKIILEEFKNIDKMTEKDFKEAKEMLLGLKRVFSEESMNVMNDLVYYELATKAEDYYEYERKINEITLNDVKKLAKVKDYSIATIVPK